MRKFALHQSYLSTTNEACKCSLQCGLNWREALSGIPIARVSCGAHIIEQLKVVILRFFWE